jgi:hypothetical protein
MPPQIKPMSAIPQLPGTPAPILRMLTAPSTRPTARRADWVDHAHPEVTGPAGVKQAVQTIRAARPDLHFTIHSILGEDDLIAVVGSVGQPQPSTDSPGRLIWLIRLVDGLMAEMWTYQQNQPSR